MKEDKSNNTNQQEAVETRTHEMSIEGSMAVKCTYPYKVYSNQQLLNASIVFTTLVEMNNLPVEVNISGYSHLSKVEVPVNSYDQLELTESILFEEQEDRQGEDGEDREKEGQTEQNGQTG